MVLDRGSLGSYAERLNSTRRRLLESLGVGMAAMIHGSLEGTPETLLTPYYTGVPDYLKDNSRFEAELEDLYIEDFEGFDPDRPNVLVDVIPVGDHQLEEEVARAIEEVHNEAPVGDEGINAFVGRRKPEYAYPEDEFVNEYGGDAAMIHGVKEGYDDFFEREVPAELRVAAIQVLRTPGVQSSSYDLPEGALEFTEDLDWEEEYCDNDHGCVYMAIASGTNIVMAPEEGFKHFYGDEYIEGTKRVALHDIGHAFDLEHSDNPQDVMYAEEGVQADSDLSFTPEEWKVVEDQWRE